VRTLMLMILGIASVGCATHQERVPAVAERPSAKRYYAPAPAAALAFDPPMVSYAPLPAFSREGRSPAAFYGYEQPTVDTYYLYQRDQQNGAGYPDQFNRTTHSSRASTTYR